VKKYYMGGFHCLDWGIESEGVASLDPEDCMLDIAESEDRK